MKKLYFLAILMSCAFCVNSSFAQYTVSQTGTFSPIDISSGSTNVTLGDDEVSGNLPIGFSFGFYGNNYSDFYVSSNGFITFSPGQSQGCCEGGLIPNPQNSNNPDNMIALAWTDLLPQSGTVIRYKTIGTAPNRILIVEYNGINCYSGLGSVTTQVKLFEGSNLIELHTTSFPIEDGRNHTQGIENADGTLAAFVSGRVATPFSLTNDFVSFTPVGTGETNLIASQCGFTMPSNYSIVYANLVAGAQGYRFRVTNLATNAVVIKDYALRNLYMTSLSNFQYNQTYSVEVAVKKAGVWEPYGASCNVTTPNPTTQLRVADCGAVKQRNDIVYADLVQFAQGYRFKVVNLSTSSIQEIDRPIRSLYLSSITDYTPIGVMRGGAANTYFISVAIKNTDGTYLPYGPSCFVEISSNMPNAVARGIDQTETETYDVFKAVAYPNPFDSSFKLELNTNSTSKVSIAIYDMIGKQLENRELSVSEMSNYEIGYNLTTGVYNVILSQDGTTQTLRMVKR